MNKVTNLVLLAFLLWGIFIATAVISLEVPKEDALPKKPGPDISHCFADDETRELWDCIRHEKVMNAVVVQVSWDE